MQEYKHRASASEKPWQEASKEYSTGDKCVFIAAVIFGAFLVGLMAGMQS